MHTSILAVVMVALSGCVLDTSPLVGARSGITSAPAVSGVDGAGSSEVIDDQGDRQESLGSEEPGSGVVEPPSSPAPGPSGSPPPPAGEEPVVQVDPPADIPQVDAGAPVAPEPEELPQPSPEEDPEPQAVACADVAPDLGQPYAIDCAGDAPCDTALPGERVCTWRDTELGAMPDCGPAPMVYWGGYLPPCTPSRDHCVRLQGDGWCSTAMRPDVAVPELEPGWTLVEMEHVDYSAQTGEAFCPISLRCP